MIDRLAQIAILRRHLVTQLFRSLTHALFQRVGEFGVAAFEQQAHVAYGFLILSRRAQPFDTWSKTTLDVILQTGARRLAVDVNVAGAQLKSPIDQVDGFSRQAGRQKGAEVERAVFLNAARNHDLRKGLVNGQLQVRIRLVVFEFVVEARLVLLDEGCFEDQRFNFIVGDNEFNVGDLPHQLARLDIVAELRELACLEILPHPAAQILGLADVENLPGSVFVQVHSR